MENAENAENAKKQPAVEIPPACWPGREEAARSLLFSAGRLGPLATRTRTWVPAMVPWRATDEGFVTEQVLDWYGRFADGQPGVLVVEATGIREVKSGPLLRIGDDRFLPGLEKLVEVVRRRSGGQTRLLIQIIDFLTIRRRPNKQDFLSRFLKLGAHHREALARLEGQAEAKTYGETELRAALLGLPEAELLLVLNEREREALLVGYRERVDDLHLEHIARLPEVLPGLFAGAAERAVKAGFDGVELHFAHAYTMASFLSRTNQRSDGYGQTLRNRVRLPLEVYGHVRAQVGREVCVGCRLLGDEVIEGGSRIDEAAYFSAELARAGIDFVSVSKGGKFEDAKQPKIGAAAYPYTGPSGHECMPTVRIGGSGPFGRNLSLAREIRTTLLHAGCSSAVVAAGGINSFELAENALQDGTCDYVAAARQSLADPDWWRKLELGRGAQVRRCLYTNYCEALDQRHVEVTCQLWDREFSEPDVGGRAPQKSQDGKRRLAPPAWSSAPE